MNTKPSIINEPATTAFPRSQHRTLKGRCRQLAADPAKTLCFDHARAEQQAKNDFTLLAPLVRNNADDFQSAAINETLGALHNLLAEGCISPRRAAVIAYVDSLILGTLPAMAKEDGQTSIILICPVPSATDPTAINPSVINTSHRNRHRAPGPLSQSSIHDRRASGPTTLARLRRPIIGETDREGLDYGSTTKCQLYPHAARVRDHHCRSVLGWRTLGSARADRRCRAATQWQRS